VLWLLPANSGANSTRDAILAVPAGAGWLSSILDSAAHASAGRGTLIALCAAALSTAIALALVRDWHPRPFLALAIAISLGYWVLGQGLGGIFTGSATDVGAGPLMILIAATLLARACTGPTARHHGSRSARAQKADPGFARLPSSTATEEQM
jgi:hypothetical protein